MLSLKLIEKISGNTILFQRFIATTKILHEKYKCKVLVVGGGTGGCAVAAKLSSQFSSANSVIVVDPSDKHYYQPMFTMIGGGMKNLSQSYKLMKDVLPKKAKFIQEKVINFNPNCNTVMTNNGREIEYDILLLGMGLQLNYDKIPGLIEALSIPYGNVSSIYSPKYVNRTFFSLKQFKNGNAIFTFPASPVKCPGAPQKIMYITEHYLRKNNKRNNSKIIYNTSLPVLFGVKHYADALWKVVEKRNIEVNLRRNLIEVKPEKNIAIFENLDDPREKYETKYCLLHVVPPMSPPNELTACKDLINSTGFVDVNESTMQHNKYKNVFAIGDCAGTPNSKTAASAAAQSPIVFKHILATLKGKELSEKYNGYASCPLVTGYDSCILAEFDYSLTPLETFPFPQNKERYSMFLMKKDLMPILYWQLMLKGLWNGPETMRKILSVFKFSK